MADQNTLASAVLFVQAVAPAVSFVLGFLSAVFVEPVREWIFRPILALSFTGQHDTIAHTKTVTGQEAVYVRVKVVNTKRKLARAIRAYLVKVETKDVAGRFAPTIYTDSIQLAWSCREKGSERAPLDLSKGVAQYIDMIATNSAANSYAVQISPIPIRYAELFTSKPQTLRFTVQVAGDGVDPQVIRLIFDWKGRWDAVDVYQDNSQGKA